MILQNLHFIAFLDGPDAGPENSLAGYARSFFGSDGDPALDVDAIKGIDQLRAVKPPFVDREARLRALPPDVVDQLMTKEGCLLRSIGREWHIPPGESLIKSWVEVLSQEFDRCPSGAVVVVRQTDKAVVAYLLPHIRVHVETGAVHREGPRPLDSVLLVRAAHSATPVHPMAAGGDDSVHMTLEFTAELAFALPEPWGALASAGLHFIDMMLPKEKKVSVVEQIVDALDVYMKQRDLNKWARGAQTLMMWCSQQLSQMKEQDPPLSQVRELLLPDLETNLTPGGSSLYSHLMSIAGQDYINEKEAFDILLVCVSSYLFGLKFKLVLDAYVAHKAYVDNDMHTFNEWNNRWRFDYIAFRDAILGDKAMQGWAPKAGQIITNFVTQRLSKVTPVERKTYTAAGHQGGGTVDFVRAHGWAFGDTQTGADNWKNHYFPDSEDGKNLVEHRDDAEAARNGYLHTLSNTLDRTYDNAKKTAQKWVDSINEWNEHLPPAAPIGRPKIDPKGWQGKASADSEWAKRTRVSYAVQFYNDKGPGLIGEWSEAVDINGRAAPTLIEVPTDDLRMATGRRIYRKFDSEKERLIQLIPNNTTRTCVDQH
jgi:hypothetical protein